MQDPAAEIHYGADAMLAEARHFHWAAEALPGPVSYIEVGLAVSALALVEGHWCEVAGDASGIAMPCLAPWETALLEAHWQTTPAPALAKAA